MLHQNSLTDTVGGLDPASIALATLSVAPTPIALFDEEDRLIEANAAFDAIFLRGLPLLTRFEDILRHGFRHGFGVRVDCGDIEQFLPGVLARRRSEAFRCLIGDMVDGTWLWMTETLLADGKLLCVGYDVTQLKDSERMHAAAHALALSAARTDELTGAPNRRHILDLCARRAGADASEALTLALIDLDNFKQINDTLGHVRGDAVLRHFALQCRRHLKGGTLGRFGGEEFLLLLDTDCLQAAGAAIDRLRSLLPACEGTRYSFSAGVCRSLPGETIEATIRRADQALYAAKRAGKARTCISEVRQAVLVP